MSSIEQVVGICCLGRLGWEMGDGGFILFLIVRIGE